MCSSYRDRVTKVAPECLRKASVAEQMSWDIVMKEKALFEKALDGENLSCEEPVLDESGGSVDTEMPDMAAEPPNNLEEDNPPVMNEDDGPRVSESPVAGDENPNEGCASSIPRISGQRSCLVLLATEKRPCSPRSSNRQFVAHLERSLWISRCSRGVICLHDDDTLGTGDEPFESKLKELD